MTGRTKHALILVTVACAAVLCLAGCSISVGSSNNSSSSKNANEDIIVTLNPGTDKESQTTLAQIYAEMKDNSQAGHKKYDGATISLTSTYKSSDSNHAYNTAALGKIDLDGGIMAEYSKTYEDLVLDLHKGDRVKVTGWIGGIGTNYISLWNHPNNSTVKYEDIIERA